MERNDKCFCGSGKKYKVCHYRINGESKLANIYRAYHSYDKVCKEKGICNNCVNGCSKCCSDFFFISELEFLVILEYLDYNKVDIQGYINKANAVADVISKNHSDLIKKIDEYMPKSFETGIRNSFFDDSINPTDIPPCIFLNDEQKCSIYEIRPSICREYGTSEHCKDIGNSNLDFQEKRDLLFETSIISSSANQQRILKRPYPLFYWFSFFMKEPYYNTMMDKMRMIRNAKNDDYYNFNIFLT